jgi:hypothetical protein
MAGGKGRSPYLLNILQDLGLMGTTDVVVDAGDSSSYPGTGQTLFDLSGNGNDYYLGLTSSATATDPTFNGTAGVADEGTYFSFDGGDLFTMTAAKTFYHPWSKAGGKFTIGAIWYSPGWSFGNFQSLMGCAYAGQGINFGTSAITGNIYCEYYPDGAFPNSVSSSIQPAAGWHFSAISFDDPALLADFQVDGSAVQRSINDVTSTVNPSEELSIGAWAERTDRTMMSGGRIAAIFARSTSTSIADLATLYSEIKSRRSPSIP